MSGGVPSVKVSAIVVTHEARELLPPCLTSLRRSLERVDGGTEIVLVDNASSDGSRELVRERFPDVRLVERPDNLGFGPAVNDGVRRSSGEWVLLLNNDATIEADAVEELLSVGESGEAIGAVAAQMRFVRDPDMINSAGIGVDRLGIAYDRLLGKPATVGETEPIEVFGASAGGALLRRTMLSELGGFDESFFIWLEDADLAWRAKMRGWRAIYAPRAVVHHHHAAAVVHGSSTKYFHVGLNRVRVLAKNADAGHLRRYGAAMLLYDLGYVAFAALRDRTLAPLHGRIQGLREWRTYRRMGDGLRRPVELEPVQGFGAALRRRAAWALGSFERSATAAIL